MARQSYYKLSGNAWTDFDNFEGSKKKTKTIAQGLSQEMQIQDKYVNDKNG